MKRRSIAWVAGAMVACLTGSASAAAPPAQAALTLSYTAGEVTDATMQYGGRTRRLLYYVPRGFDPSNKHPLVLVLHGFNQPVDSIVRTYGSMRPRADADGTILVYPVSTGDLAAQSMGWNTRYGTFANTTFPELDEVDDVAWLSFLIDLFTSGMNADPDRVYLTGTSMGGAMIYTASCHFADRLAAIAPAIMQMGSKLARECAAARPLPVLIVTGTADPLVPSGGNEQDPSRDEIPLLSAEDNISFWKIRNGITRAPVKSDLPNPVSEVFKGQPAPSHIEKYVWPSPKGAEIVWLKVVNGGHWLPTATGGKALDASNLGGFDGTFLGNYNCDYDASGAIYDFLLSHTRRP